MPSNFFDKLGFIVCVSLVVVIFLWPRVAIFPAEEEPPEEKVQFGFALKWRYNFITLPVYNTSIKASNLGLTTGDVIWEWNESQNTWTKNWNPGAPPFKDFFLKLHHSYMIYSQNNKSIYVWGWHPNGTYYRALYPKLPNVACDVGLCSLKQTWHAADIATMYSGPGAVTAVQKLNATTQVYSTWAPGDPPFKNFSIYAGTGLWVFVSQNGTLAYNA